MTILTSPATLSASGSWSMSSINATTAYAQTYIGEFNNLASSYFKAAILFSTLSDGTIPQNAVVSTATLKIYAKTDYANNVGTISVYRLRRLTAATMTWTISKTGTSWTTAGAASTTSDIDSSLCGSLATIAAETLNEYKLIPLNPVLVQAMINGTWANNGFLLRTVGTDDGYEYQHFTDANPPKLLITYTAGGQAVFFI